MIPFIGASSNRKGISGCLGTRIGGVDWEGNILQETPMFNILIMVVV
jgi:hypothetical protein